MKRPVPIHSGDGPDHHHHHHHHHRHEYKTLGDATQVGTIAHAVATIIAALQALPANRDRHLAMGHSIARLLESEHVDGVSSVLVEITHSVDRYNNS